MRNLGLEEELTKLPSNMVESKNDQTSGVSDATKAQSSTNAPEIELTKVPHSQS